MGKKKIIIIAVVVVALYVLYKRGTFDSLLSGSGADTLIPTSDTKADIDLSDTDAIIEATSMSSAEKKKCKNWVAEIKRAIKQSLNGWSKTSVEAKAKDQKVTYEQYLVIAALWQMYETAGIITRNKCDEYANEVRNL